MQAGKAVEDVGGQGGDAVVGENKLLQAVVEVGEDIGVQRRQAVAVQVELLQVGEAVEDGGRQRRQVVLVQIEP